MEKYLSRQLTSPHPVWVHVYSWLLMRFLPITNLLANELKWELERSARSYFLSRIYSNRQELSRVVLSIKSRLSMKCIKSYYFIISEYNRIFTVTKIFEGKGEFIADRTGYGVFRGNLILSILCLFIYWSNELKLVFF